MQVGSFVLQHMPQLLLCRPQLLSPTPRRRTCRGRPCSRRGLLEGVGARAGPSRAVRPLWLKWRWRRRGIAATLRIEKWPPRGAFGEGVEGGCPVREAGARYGGNFQPQGASHHGAGAPPRLQRREVRLLLSITAQRYCCCHTCVS